MKQTLLLLTAGLAFASCSDSTGDVKTTAPETQSIEAKVSSKELNENFDNAWNARDTTKLYSLIADDVQMLDGTEHFSGKKEVIEKFIQKDLPVTSNLKTNVVSSGEDNGLAYETGTFSLDVNVPNVKPFVTKGNYNFVWKKGADNVWKVASINMEDWPAGK